MAISRQFWRAINGSPNSVFHKPPRASNEKPIATNGRTGASARAERADPVTTKLSDGQRGRQKTGDADRDSLAKQAKGKKS